MGLKAGWLALCVFVWMVGAFLGSTFEYQSASGVQGQAYSTGTATFTNGSTTVTGVGTTWIAGMEGGNIQSDADGVWHKILSIDAVNQLTLYSPYSSTGGAGLVYTMAVSPGFVGSGTGGYTSTPVETFSTLMDAQIAVQRSPIIGAFSVITNGEFWASVGKFVFWQWSFLYNADGTMAYGLFYWIFLFPWVAMGMFSMLLIIYGALTGNLTW